MLRVYVNSDDVLLQWTVDVLDDHCLGFAIQRRLTRGGTTGTPTWLDNYASPGAQAHQSGAHQSSEAWPFRCFTWTDHSVDRDDKVSYRIVPVLSGAPAVREDLASDWSDERTIAPAPQATYEASFNRGFVISQFISRYLDEHYPGVDRDKALQKFKQDIGADLEDRVRVFLSGQVRATMLALLDDLATGDGHLYAALFELADEQLVAALERLGARAHVVLANGSVEPETGVSASQARERDENEAARRRLIAAGVDVSGRFVSPGALAHNKFAVITTSADEPIMVWTGSTNWTTTGLCTQLNNGLLARDAAVAALYRAQWQALRDAGSEHPAALATANATPGTVGGDPTAVRASVHFTRATQHVDLAALRDIVLTARQGVLFLMFIPGASGVLADVRKLAKDRPDLLVRGVVSELPRGREDAKTGDTTTVRVALVGANSDALEQPQTFDVIQPQGMAHPAAGWALETTRKQFQGDVGHAIIHSKVLVVDPFTDDPTVVTGSHNFSISASEKNDENFIVIRGDQPLAEAYAVNIQSAWRHYAARIANPHPTLLGTDYLRALLDDQRREEHFWQLGNQTSRAATSRP
jgi:phosphatidylserine/phosphatidylglycerophosphate/cardiolipin synthase-like enzyme